ncbi:hypothetical protein MGYG_00582 [Nannizzia gypsea CBS 118893]|uniref:Uncharacterized protein n=1 Tax=Arthroderma gypseum (strain ATCC MYA-4604 / CBS 118893) TaxID=535722 RepID=E5R0I2_ARTGP|nr:hypothetical protein MGYG_00582 [Nannizzia gypsea CBS 118893]EFQ97541.1 hypothetical protein MGYG_00582 [Nannizzia gypsea CBS 118893]
MIWRQCVTTEATKEKDRDEFDVSFSELVYVGRRMEVETLPADREGKISNKTALDRMAQSGGGWETFNTGTYAAHGQGEMNYELVLDSHFSIISPPWGQVRARVRRYRARNMRMNNQLNLQYSGCFLVIEICAITSYLAVQTYEEKYSETT